jgi:hypothetical protein
VLSFIAVIGFSKTMTNLASAWLADRRGSAIDDARVVGDCFHTNFF